MRPSFLALSLLVCLSACAVEAELDPNLAADGGLVEETPDAAQAPTIARVFDTDGLGLRIRSGPSTNDEAIGSIPEGCLVTLLGEREGDWYPVEYRELRGYSHKDFLTLEEDDAEDCKIADDAMLLPWDQGESHKVTNGHHTNTHTGYDDWAWDFGMPVGTPLLAVHGGTIRKVKGNSSVGGCSQAYISDANYVVIDRGDGTESLYFHLSSTSVTAGQTVQRGQVIGYSGQTGWACGPHLHFQVQQGPTNGGTASAWNPSIHAFFYDTGAALDPAEDSSPSSANARL